ncbi:MAG: putative ABC transporter ATP-binding protein [Firmicutes bacterium ADurb.Bin300]|nr:MAG: putative ABC transporter ATP-binding protein [Firmicutes bacterium ADurb.Bin300]
MPVDNLIANSKIPEEIRERMEKLLESDENAVFALIGDLDLKGRYGLSAVIVTEKRVFAFDKSHPDGLLIINIAQIKQAKVKRMYGNAMLCAQFEDSKVNLIRFTYSIAALADAAADFFLAVSQGQALEKEIEAVEATFEKMKAFCPKCGRSLSRPGAECINCASKGKLVKKLYVYIAPERNRLIGCLLLSIITTTMALTPPYITKLLVDDIIKNLDYQKLANAVGTLFLIYMVQYVIGTWRGHIMRVSGDRTVTRLRNDIYAKAQYLPLSFYDKTSTGSVFARVSGDTNTLQAFMLRISQEALVQLLLMIGIIVIMFTLDWKLTLLSLVPVPLVVLGSRYFGKRIFPIYRRIWRRWSSVSSILSDTLPGIRVIKSFTSEERAISKFNEYNEEWLKEDTRASVIANIFPHAVGFFVTCGSLFIWGIGGKWVIDGIANAEASAISLGLLVSFISYAGMFYGPVNFFANLNDSYQSALSSAERILDIIDAEPEQDFGKGNEVKRFMGKIEFRNVSFSFDKTKKTLNNINLTINPGDIVGIVGTTGSGKSTLVNLLMRFYDNYEGDISVDNMNIKEIDLKSFRSKIGYVQQEPLMFRDTVFRNIAYSNPNASVEEVIHAADIANAHCFIARLPDAYDTMLGERGAGLSGGERQRLSIARAVLKNPSILIFDEATAAVDSETEELIQTAVERLISGRTTLMIAHRLSTLRKANKIIVVDKGEIIECGSHEELMALGGKYHKLIEIQNMSEKIRKSKENENLE